MTPELKDKDVYCRKSGHCSLPVEGSGFYFFPIILKVPPTKPVIKKNSFGEVKVEVNGFTLTLLILLVSEVTLKTVS